uniref:glycosyltransferase 87 family protein n=1 Tax=Nonomuraea pusilla TaxID=46177 RepID=UPI001EEF33AE|nr:glycosyltransferase 87 family protein [Nonomuraea pusilla]
MRNDRLLLASSRLADARLHTVNRRTVPAVAVLAALVAVLVLAFVTGALAWYAAAWALFAVALAALRGVPSPVAGRLVLAGGLAAVATGLLAPPATSTDSFRYAWDGRVQSAGLSPYDRPPSDPALAGLRDGWLFPGCAEGRFYPLPDGGCTRINRPTVHTIYPPLAEAYFWLVDRLSPRDARHKPFQVGGALAATATSAVLLAAARRRGRERLAACWAWCPAVPMEAVNNAHVDALAVAAVALALALPLAPRSRPPGVPGPGAAGGLFRGLVRGVVLGAGIAVKLSPAVVLPALLAGRLSDSRRRHRLGPGLAAVGAALAVVGAAYLPYVLLSHGSVLGYLPGYAAEEGYADAAARGRYALLRLVLPDAWAPPAALAVLAAVWVRVLLRGDPERPWRGALEVSGAAFLVLTPGYSWYALLVVALVALDGRVEWLGVAAASAAAYLTGAGTTAYAVAAAAVAAGMWLRRPRDPLTPPRGPVTPPPPRDDAPRTGHAAPPRDAAPAP